jgi:3-oxoacyl-[acyl-carrier-protein] synthase III
VSARIAPSVGEPHARILGLGAYRPARVVTNEEICRRIDSSDEWIRSRSGIVTRRWAAEDETVADMSVAAAGKALADAGIAPEELGCVLVATCTHPFQTPAAAPEVAQRIGAVRAAAFDVSAACAGFCHAIALANDMVRGGSARHVVVIGAEKLSSVTDLDDRSTAFIFADGAGAVVVGPSDEPGIGPVVWGADGRQLDAIRQNASWHNLAVTGQPAYLVMNGQQVFRWAVYDMVPVAQRALEAAGLTADDLDAFVPHQANMRITDAMVRALKLPEHVAVARDIAEQGNTSAASIPLAMDRLREMGRLRSGGMALLIGFGAGLSFAAQVVRLP